MSERKSNDEAESLLAGLMRFTGQVAGGTLEIARHTATMSAMFGEGWVRQMLLHSMEPERLEAMADAGHFLRDARETAGLSLKELADSLGLSDKTVLEEVERGDKIMPLELVLRSASLLARHDPVPFLIKFLRTYNPQLEQVLEQWGVMALPRQYERERRFVNLYRQHDALRGLSDDEHDRFIQYIDSAAQLVLDVMQKEKAANSPPMSAPKRPSPARKRTPRKRS
ncbi:MAG: helix-turn-helix domain-containing protein [Halieaceae bacterium]|uniref:helix-turn-helix domain-containing protein n=1 Tax=Haliea alexandrii TaxID=2448162 RepID=UPI000F0B2DCC|nr:helix-turn-helix domain-containing protein [Haliea alexandrii]MCR9184648.1 helix-turn-helix domain-containing protein [Halieaceae bacterium]